ncbi:putative ribonuclease H-like domain-containing protein [Tanacetum coccineum]|uniref:Ribonuclease H-like domain-containing protein n=1 Tax=Tanacetum coccineum TaxID=301880 RepID=A0ABQ4XWN9_9ASTR
MVENQILQKDKKGLGFTEHRASTSKDKMEKMGQESAKKPYVDPAHPVPSEKVPASANGGYRASGLANEILKPIIQNRSEFVQITKKTSPSTTVRNTKQTPSLKLGHGVGKVEPDEWIKDSGCSRHMTGNKDLLSTYEAINGCNVVFGSNTKSKIIGKEVMEFESANSNTTAKLPILKLAQESGTLVTKMSVPVTAEEKANEKNDVKARSLLLMTLPNEHQLTFRVLIMYRLSANTIKGKGWVKHANANNRLSCWLGFGSTYQTLIVHQSALKKHNFIDGTRHIQSVTHPNAQRNMVPRAVLMKTGLKPFNTVRTVNTAHPKSIVFSAKSMSCFLKIAQSTVRRPFQSKTTLSNKRFTHKVNTAKAQAVNTTRPQAVNTARPKTVRPNSAVVNAVKVNQANAVKASACWVWRPTKPNSASITLKKHNYIDARGRSKHMTGNIAYLIIIIKEFDGGYVTFRGRSSCGRIFWRLGHINFKNINKLVKDNLVRGLPTKRFENDQTCVACLKGKQHRASCKSKVLNPITKPLFMLHIDLFGPTFVSSLMHKKYCLVVTDDYSRFTWVFFLTTKDETSEILKNFIKEIENLVDKKVKIIRSDNGTEFKNKVMDDFCREKGIKREYSVARTPQQNGVAERRNRTLIEAARTMLADSKLPTTFWAEAVSTACYTILDSLGKFDGKSDEGFFVGYSLSSKAFRVYNTRTRRVEENLHIGFLENKPMIEGNGPKWLFDIDSLTQSMNYVPVAAGTIINESAGTQGELNAGTSEEISQDCIVMPIWKDASYFDSPSKDVDNGEPKSAADDQKQVEDGLDNENDEKDKSDDDSSPKEVNAAGQHVNTASPDVNTGSFKLNTVDPSVNTASSYDQDSPKDMFTMGASHTLEATHVEFFSDEDEPEVDLGNITNSYTVPTTPNTRIHKDHPIENVIGDVKSSVQTRRMTKPTSEQGFLSAVYEQKTHDTLNTCLYACFLSQIEPTSIAKALSDSSWVEAMQEELLQFKL